MTKRPAGDKLARHLAARVPAASPCYGYARVSTVQQADEGSIAGRAAARHSRLRQMHGLTIDKTFVERGVSGSKPPGDRPQGAALLATLRPGDTVITPKLDRMFRSALDMLGKLKAAGVSLHMIDLGDDTTGNGVSNAGVKNALAAAADRSAAA